MAVKNSPLTDQHFEVLKAGLEQADAALEQIETAKRAGLDVEQFEQPARETQARLLKIKQTYFPGR